MKTYWLNIILLSATMVGCNIDTSKQFDLKRTEKKPFIFNMAHYFLDEEFSLSFPYWFNDSIIETKNIKEIIRTIYTSSAKEDTLKIPEEVQTYLFNNKGEVESIKITHYYDNQLMGEMTYLIEERDEFGYANVKALKEAQNDEEREILANYSVVKKEQYEDKFLVYTRANGDYLFYMLSEKDWGPLSVDSILKPSDEDRIILGQPASPTKKYKVSNRVNESDVVEYEYQGEIIARINYEKYPFSYHRSILFNEQGACIGFVDSTFSDNRFLTRRESMFHFENELPVRLIHENKSENSDGGYYQFETFEFKFYDANK